MTEACTARRCGFNTAILSHISKLTTSQGKEGIVIVKTKQALLVTHYPEHVQPGSAANTVEQLADYLISVNY